MKHVFVVLLTYRERDKGGWSDDGEDLRYRPPPPTVRSTTSEPKRREKTAVDITVGTQRSLQEGEKMRKTIEVRRLSVIY